MHYISSTEVRNHLAGAIEQALRGEPVMVQKQGRDVAVILSAQDFARITQNNLKDYLQTAAAIGSAAQAAGITEENLPHWLAQEHAPGD